MSEEKLENIEEMEEELSIDEQLSKPFLNYEEKNKKYGYVMAGKRKISLQFRTKEFTNKELNEIMSKDNFDLMDAATKINQSINLNFLLIYYASKLNKQRCSLQDFIKYFDDKTPKFKIEFTAANELYLEKLARLMGFND